MSRSAERRGRKRAAALLAVGLAGPTVLAGIAAADPELGPFVATSSAAGVRVGYFVPGFVVVEEFVDAGGPVAQTRLDTASADSYAALPHPGGTVLAYQGLAALAGVNSPVGYPFFVSATHPANPEQSLTDPSGGYRLSAKAGSEASEAIASAAAGSGDVAVAAMRGDASTIKADDKVTAKAVTLTEGIRVGDTLRIASVRSRSVSVRVAGEAEPKTQTELAIDGLRINDQAFGFGPQGFTVGGTPVPVPPAEANKVANQVLAPAGISLRFIEAAPVPGGAVAPVLEITAPHKLPVPGEPTGTLTLRLGGAASSVTNTDAAPLPGLDTGSEAPLPGVDTPVPPADAGALPAASAPFETTAPASPFAPAPLSSSSTPAPFTGSSPVGSDDVTEAATTGAQAVAAPVAAARPGLVIRATDVGGMSAAYGAVLVAVVAALLGAFAWFRGGMKAWLGS